MRKNNVQVTCVGHLVAAMIGVLAAAGRRVRFGRVVAVQMQASSHCRNLWAPGETIAAIKACLG